MGIAELGEIIDKEQFPDRYVIFDGVTTAQKSDPRKLRSRLPITLDVVITGTATVNVYASNIAETKDSTKWGAPILTLTASAKRIITGEPWANWMFEYAAGGTGTVDVAVGV